MAEIVFAQPKPTYFVTISATVMLGGQPYVIEPIHRREGDIDDNRIVRVLLQNITFAPGVPLAVLDESNTECMRLPQFNPTLGTGSPYPIITDVKLKIAAISPYSDATFQAMVYYAKPDR